MVSTTGTYLECHLGKTLLSTVLYSAVYISDHLEILKIDPLDGSLIS